jgi:ribosomal protein S18 acetylase RimI-like enzyme
VIARTRSFNLPSAMNIQYRRALQADGPAVFELLWSARNEIPLRESFYSEANRAWITKKCRRRRVWVADSDGLIVGMLYVHFEELFYLVVDENYRKRGIARRLLATCVKPNRWARVAPGNAPVIALLKSEGFYHNPDRVTASGWTAYQYRRPRC